MARLSCVNIRAACVFARTHACLRTVQLSASARGFVRVSLENTTAARTQRDIVPAHTAPSPCSHFESHRFDLCSVLPLSAVKHQRVRRTLGAHPRRAPVPSSSRGPRPHVKKQRHLPGHPTRVLRHCCLGHLRVLQRACHGRRCCRQAAGLPRSGNARADAISDTSADSTANDGVAYVHPNSHRCAQQSRRFFWRRDHSLRRGPPASDGVATGASDSVVFETDSGVPWTWSCASCTSTGCAITAPSNAGASASASASPLLVGTVPVALGDLRCIGSITRMCDRSPRRFLCDSSVLGMCTLAGNWAGRT